jgi:hypothetical protein
MYSLIKKSLAQYDYSTKTRKNILSIFNHLTMITYLESGITNGVSVHLVSVNVWRLAGDTLKITFNFLYCNHQ